MTCGPGGPGGPGRSTVDETVVTAVVVTSNGSVRLGRQATDVESLYDE